MFTLDSIGHVNASASCKLKLMKILKSNSFYLFGVNLLHVSKVTQAVSSGFVDFLSLHAWNEG